jgi:ribosomal protein S18 acetylase RimI-like enzyme
MTPEPIIIRPARAEDLAAYRELRLEALRAHPDAFGSDHDEQAAEPESAWAQRIARSVEGRTGRLLLVEAAGGELAGMAAVYLDGGVKTRHVADLVSVYVRPGFRGRRLGDALIGEALAWCATAGVRIVRLGVGTGNARAIRCYRRCGFQVCGVQPEAIRLGAVYFDEFQMWRRVCATSAASGFP